MKTPGIVLFDGARKPVYASEGALRILPNLEDTDRVAVGTEVYRLTRIPVAGVAEHGRVRMAVVIETAGRRHVDLSAVASRYNLTTRERSVADLLLEGLPTRVISHKLGISPNTVKAFVRIMSGKTGVSGRTALIAKLLREAIAAG